MNLDKAVEKISPILSGLRGSDGYRGVCSFGYVSETQGHKANHYSACHASIESYRLNNKAYFYSTLTLTPDKQNRESLEQFAKWGLSDTSPWRTLLKDRERVLVEDNGAITGYVIEVHPEDSRVHLSNLCMALRFCSEHRKSYEAHEAFMDAGLSRTDAFFLAQHFKRTGPDTVTQEGVDNSNHIIVPVPEDFNLKRFEEGNPYRWGDTLGGQKLSDPNKSDALVQAFYSRTTTAFRDEGRFSKLGKIRDMVRGRNTKMKGRWTQTNALHTKDVVKFYNEEYKPIIMQECVA